jgi:hypothetical protein
MHTYHSRLIPEGAAEASQIFLQDAHFLLKLLSFDRNSLVTFYDIHGRMREVLFFYFVPDTTQDIIIFGSLETSLILKSA